MKKIILLTSFVLFIVGCEKNDQNNREIITENAIVYYRPNSGAECILTLRTERNYSYALENINTEFKEDELQVKISYYITDEVFDCGFGGNLNIIEIVNIEKIEQN